MSYTIKTRKGTQTVDQLSADVAAMLRADVAGSAAITITNNATGADACFTLIEGEALRTEDAQALLRLDGIDEISAESIANTVAHWRGTLTVCGNCGAVTPLDQIAASLFQVDSLAERLTPGAEVPAGECGECDTGAFVYIVRRGDPRLHDRIDLLRTAVETGNAEQALSDTRKILVSLSPMVEPSENSALGEAARIVVDNAWAHDSNTVSISRIDFDALSKALTENTQESACIPSDAAAR